ncbi:hypothetical protein [Alteromonas macleodii]|uniref:Uncharacterized protein n=1 Tax=Alteromonas macleodii TaxID=28108 RepID=A0AB36FME3_ALTMA|nr:hypothetical protein [Alteromonas macleodii]OES24038.1 hypothetical protein BFV95_4877 [Alteromonas macleodii]OES25367.1 hypothetical protein BFV93_4471 [Alteromonas macleodii]OES25716.1 hypothetical protein BFV94_4323 [Alteromonas macleodii]OES38606.1 hypothetical protein BFV96_4717 [Alteromonas macleodii]
MNIQPDIIQQFKQDETGFQYIPHLKIDGVLTGIANAGPVDTVKEAMGIAEDYAQKVRKGVADGSIKVSIPAPSITAINPKYQTTVDRFVKWDIRYNAIVDATEDNGGTKQASAYEKAYNAFHSLPKREQQNITKKRDTNGY